MSKEVIILTGATGFIGSKILNKIVETEKLVVSLSRKPSADKQNLKQIQWQQGQEIRFDELDKKLNTLLSQELKQFTLIHCSFDFINIKKNFEDSKMLFDQLKYFCKERKVDFKIIFISSMSAYPGVRSDYGITKQKIEKLLSTEDLIVRPGFVIGEDGICGKIKTIIRKSPIVPVPFGLKELQTIEVAELADRLLQNIAAERIGEVNLYSKVQTFLSVCKGLEPNLKRLIIPIPGAFVYFLLKIMEFFKISTGLRSDSLVSLKNIKIWLN